MGMSGSQSYRLQSIVISTLFDKLLEEPPACILGVVIIEQLNVAKIRNILYLNENNLPLIVRAIVYDNFFTQRL